VISQIVAKSTKSRHTPLYFLGAVMHGE
jgi:hypothetical protein